MSSFKKDSKVNLFSRLTAALLLAATPCWAGDGMPQGAITFIDATDCDADWSTYTDADGFFLIPLTSDDSTWGQPVGSSISGNAFELPHEHSLSGEVNVGNKDWCSSTATNTALSAGKPGNQNYSGETSEGITNLPWMRLLICEKTSAPSSGAATPPSGMLAFFESACPTDWSGTEDYDGRYLVALPSGASPAVFGGSPVDGTSAPSHTHDYSVTFDISSQKPALATGCWNGYAKSNDRTATGVTDAAETGFSYLPLLLCKKD
ncbi:MAG: hypothetical protein AAGM22_29485 [Acidobacteriota bacterium]